MLLAQEQSHPQRLNEMLAMVPWIVIFLALWILIYRFLKRENRRREELKAAKAHAAALQEQLNKMTGAAGPTKRE